MSEPQIKGGYILLSRKIIESEIWNKPPLYLKVWIYILSKAQHKPYNNLERGETFISIPEIIEACSYKVGFRTEKPTKKQIFGILEWLRNPHGGNDEGNNEGNMIVTTKVTHGMILKVCNYNVYQDPKSYEGNNESQSKETTRGQRREREGNNKYKNVKNDKNDKNDNYNSRKRVYDESSIHFILAKRLYDKILENNPNHKQPNLQKWANDIRLMMERDKRTQEQIIYVIDWCQNNDFWKSNILSVSKLREKFDQLVIQIKSKHNSKVRPFKKPNYEVGESVEKNDGKNITEFGNVRLFK